MNEKKKKQEGKEPVERDPDGGWYDPEIGDWCYGPFDTFEEFWEHLHAPDPSPAESTEEPVAPEPRWISFEEVMKQHGITDEDIEAAGDVEIE